VLGLLLLRRPAVRLANAFTLPERLTPFTVIGLLRQIQASGRLSQPQEFQMRSDLATLEEHFFAQAENGQIDLKPLAEGWLAKVQ